MRAIVHQAYGPPATLRLRDVEKPVPGDGEVLVRVRAAGVNPLDWHFVRGTPYAVRLVTGLFGPRSPRLGTDLAGVVEAPGEKVDGFRPGDEVYGAAKGAYAEYVCASQEALVPKPAGLSFEQAATVPIAAWTALQFLRDRGGIEAGQQVLVNGASGGVGTFAVQLAKAFGAEVTGVCSTRNVELVRSIGADHVVDYTRDDFTRGAARYDLVFDTIGNHPLSACRRVMAPRAKLLMVGSAAEGRWLGPLSAMWKMQMAALPASQKVVSYTARRSTDDLRFLNRLFEAGEVTPVIDRRYPLDRAGEAIAYVEQGHARGKVVVTVG